MNSRPCSYCALSATFSQPVRVGHAPTYPPISRLTVALTTNVTVWKCTTLILFLLYVFDMLVGCTNANSKLLRSPSWNWREIKYYPFSYFVNLLCDVPLHWILWRLVNTFGCNSIHIQPVTLIKKTVWPRRCQTLEVDSSHNSEICFPQG